MKQKTLAVSNLWTEVFSKVYVLVRTIPDNNLPVINPAHHRSVSWRGLEDLKAVFRNIFSDASEPHYNDTPYIDVRIKSWNYVGEGFFGLDKGEGGSYYTVRCVGV